MDDQLDNKSDQNLKIFLYNNSQPNRTCFAMDALSYLKTAGSMIPPFTGSFKQLGSFIKSVNLLKISTRPELQETLLELVHTRLEGRADRVCRDCDTVEDIIETLQTHFIPDPSDVVEARLLALKLSPNGLAKFAAAVESAADDFHESLVLEGMTEQRAQKQTIKVVKQVCRQEAPNSLITSIIASTSFDIVKEVLTTFAREVTNAEKSRKSTLRNPNNYYNNYRGNSFRNVNNSSGYRSDRFNNNGNFDNSRRNINSRNNINSAANHSQNNFRNNNSNSSGAGSRGQQFVRVATAGGVSENEDLPTDRPVGEMLFRQED